MKLKLGNNGIFHCPEGRFRGVLEAVEEPKKRINKPCAAQVRFRFRVTTPEGKEYLVGKTFCADLGYGSELHSYLESGLDGNFDKFRDDEGNIDLDLLIGMTFALLITHGPQVGVHDHPFVNIAGIFPSGRLTEQ